MRDSRGGGEKAIREIEDRIRGRGGKRKEARRERRGKGENAEDLNPKS